MISLESESEYTPCGRVLSRYHAQLDQRSNVRKYDQLWPSTSALNELESELTDFSISSVSSMKEHWTLRECVSGEEELFIVDRLLIHSKTDANGNFCLLKSYTLETNLEQAIWCNFLNEDADNTIYSAICALQANSIDVFSEDGNHYPIGAPFQISQMFESKFGMILERSDDRLSDFASAPTLLPLLFALVNPLKDITPIICKSNNTSLGFFTLDEKLEVVGVCSERSLMLLYNRDRQLHSIWNLRWASESEIAAVSAIPRPLFCTRNAGDISFNTSSMPVSGRPSVSPACSPAARQAFAKQSSFTQSPTPMSQISPNASTPQSSPLSSLRSVRLAASPGSPSIRQVSGSTSANESLLSVNQSSAFAQSSKLLSPRPSLLNSLQPELNEEVCEPIFPELCLEQLWQEPNSAQSEKASKLFLTSDLIGNHYLAYLVKSKMQLKLVRLDESNDHQRLILGTFSVLTAKDVQPLPSLQMMIILEPNGSLALHSGLHRIATLQVHWKNFLSCVPFTPAKRGVGFLDSFLQTMDSSQLATTANKPVASSSRLSITSVPFSPILAGDEPSKRERPRPAITGLRDAVRDRVTIEDASASFHRITIPPIATSSIVRLCLDALKNVLPRELSLKMLARWYIFRNAPGARAHVSAQRELRLFQQCLLEMCGYLLPGAGVGSLLPASVLSKCSSPNKKQRLASNMEEEQPSDEDWNAMQSLLQTSSTGLISGCLLECNAACSSAGLGSSAPTSTPTSHRSRSASSTSTACANQRVPINGDGILFAYMPSVLFCFHLILEEIKLDTLLYHEMQPLVELLYVLAVDLRLGKYTDFYVEQMQRKDTCLKDERSMICTSDRKQLIFPHFLCAQPPCVLTYLQQLLQEETHSLPPFPYIPETTVRIRHVILLYRCFRKADFSEKNCLQPITMKKYFPIEDLQLKNTPSPRERIVLCLDKLDLKKEQLHTLPAGVAIPLWDAIFGCKKNPPAGWSRRAYELINRDDLLALQGKFTDSSLMASMPQSRQLARIVGNLNDDGEPHHGPRTNESSDADGFSKLNSQLLRLLFPDDQRVAEACNMLQSSKPVRVAVTQRPGVSDHEFIEEQERHLYNMCIRTMALCVGRGMCTLRTYRPIIAETFPIPKLCLSGRAPPRNTAVELNHIEVPAGMNQWPLFHNGVAAGLRVASSAVDAINSTWIIYNKPKIIANQTSDSQHEHAGFLLALGLNGHICRLSMMNIHDYLCMGNELTRVALLLGLAAAKRGSMDLFAVKILSIHVEALLPPTSTELDVPPVAQVAAVLGIGLLYQASGQRHIAEVLLGEIGRPPGPEMEHYIDRESYALAAGLAFGLVTLGKGNQLVSLVSSAESVSMADQLCNYMIGGHKRPLTGMQKDKYRTPSYQIREGDYVNAHVTSPGATLALGMMFFATGNETVSGWLMAPDTQHLLEAVRPDLLLLRTLAKGLVLWDQIQPNKVWVDSHVPQIVAENALRRDGSALNQRIDYETMSQAYCNIVSGACMALALRYAGSAHPDAFKTVLLYTKMFINLTNQPTVADQAGRSTIESCLNVLVLSLSVIMAGTGNLEVLKICRYLRSRVNQVNVVLYGSQMATHMALGLLFLGGCRYTLSTSPAAVAAMICAFFPKFPIHSNDNRYHLQAFRHLYVLAAEPRLVIPRDIATGRNVYVHLQIKFNEGDPRGLIKLRAPCFLPELHQIEQLTILDSRYWKITFNKQKNWDTLSKFLFDNGVLFVKQKVGCLPYQEDPHGFKSIHSQCMMKDAVHGWSHNSNELSSFSSDPSVLNFARLLLIPRALCKQEAQLQHKLAILLFNCASNETVDCLAALIQLIKMFYVDSSAPGTGTSLVSTQLHSHRIAQLNLLADEENHFEFIPPEFFQGLRLFVEQVQYAAKHSSVKHK